MPKVEGLKRVTDVLDKRVAGAKEFQRFHAEVGYSASYAIYVHENLQARHPVGQAKFLEEAIRQHGSDVKKTVANALRRGTPPKSAIAIGAVHLMQWSQTLVPVDTGDLKRSAYARVTEVRRRGKR